MSADGLPVRSGPWAKTWLVENLGVDYFSHVRWVILSGPKADDEVMRHVGRLGRLDQLTLGETRVTDAGLAPIRGLTGLKMLAMGRNDAIEGPGLVNISGLANLRKLYFGGSKIDDADMVHLAR